MTQESKRTVVVVTATVVAIGLIVGVYVANGSEREDAWLYITSILVVIFGTWASYPKKNKGK